MVSTVTDNLNVPIVIVISPLWFLGSISALQYMSRTICEKLQKRQRRNDIADNVKAERDMSDFTFMLAINYKAQSGE